MILLYSAVESSTVQCESTKYFGWLGATFIARIRYRVELLRVLAPSQTTGASNADCIKVCLLLECSWLERCLSDTMVHSFQCQTDTAVARPLEARCSQPTRLVHRLPDPAGEKHDIFFCATSIVLMLKCSYFTF